MERILSLRFPIANRVQRRDWPDSIKIENATFM